MKKACLSIFFLLFYNCEFAQIQKGRTLLGGSLSFSQRKDLQNDTVRGRYYYENSSYNLISLRAGIFLSDGFLLGMLANQQSTSFIRETGEMSTGEYYNSQRQGESFSPGIFCRYYVMIGKSRFAFFGHLETTLGYGRGTISESSYNGFDEYQSDYRFVNQKFEIVFQPGLTYFITDRIGIETFFGSIRYNQYAERHQDHSGTIIKDSNGSSFAPNFSLGLQNISLGFNFYFGGRKKLADLAKPESDTN